jgi:CDGSH-type Zn-finger protein/truncated hemoglobin YjbI
VDVSQPGTGGTVDGRLWGLTKAVTTLCASPRVPPEVVQAAAGLQYLACRPAEAGGPERAAARVAELVELQPGLSPRIQVAANGPYLASGVTNLYTHLGEAIPTRPQMALCRCGSSSVKPSCDGACARTGFVDDKDPNRVADRRDSYIGEQVTVLDNRGICQHSGYCTDRLPTVFHLGEEPFITPSGGRMDEIIRAVRDCPSGALSYAMDNVEARGQVDYAGAREPAVDVSKDGPYRVTGGIPLVDGSGEDQPRAQGASREHYALCRCGHSQNKPFCSGMHWYVGFTDPVPDPDRTPTIFEWAGGLPALTRMTRLFYEKYVPADPLLAPIFANMSADHPQRVARWLGEVFGGPASYTERYGGYPRMVSEHQGRSLTEEWRARWVSLLMQSAQEAGLPNDPEFRSAFGSYIEWGSRLAVENSQPDARPPEHMPVPHWDWSTAAGPPGSRISALAPPAEEQEQPVLLPADDEPVRYEKHIKPLFRPGDRQSMAFAFDLWSYDDVREHSEAILARLRGGSMPCDGAWPAERVDVFQRWLDGGAAA